MKPVLVVAGPTAPLAALVAAAPADVPAPPSTAVTFGALAVIGLLVVLLVVVAVVLLVLVARRKNPAAGAQPPPPPPPPTGYGT